MHTVALEAYLELLRKEWHQHKRLLVSRKSFEDLWGYHVQDCLHLAKFVEGEVCTDVGSGAGFPGVVVAACGASHVNLVEPRADKGRFLKKILEEIQVPATLHQDRIEKLSLGQDTIIARAVGTLLWLLSHTAHLTKERILVIKSSNLSDEVKEAKKHFTFSHKIHLIPSGRGCLLEVWDIDSTKRRKIS